MKEETIKKAVREGYARIAKGDNSCCALVNSCCGNRRLAQTISKRIGYSEKELKEVPEGANLGLGCGNPIAFSSLKEGETVLDLGSGAGFDCFLAANEVGNKGRVIGETSLSIDCMANDPTVKSIIKNLNLSPNKTEEIASSVASIKVYAVKPNGSI